MQKIGEIKCEIQAAEPGEYATLFEKYKEDINLYHLAFPMDWAIQLKK